LIGGPAGTGSASSRDPIRRWRRWLAAGMTLLAGWAAWSLAAHLRHRDHPATAATDEAADAKTTGSTETDPAFDRIYLKDVSQSAYDGGEKLWSLSAEEIIHRKRKLGPLTLNPVKEVEMTGVRLEIDRPAPGPLEGAGSDRDLDLPIESILEAILSAKDLGFVSRVLVARLEMSIVQGGKSTFTLEAASASIGAEAGVVRFKGGVTLSGPAVGQLEAAEAEWRTDRRRLLVRGAAGQGGTTTYRIDRDRGLVRE
jgi:hypothetical protein